MFESFSGGYYLGRLYVQPFDGDRAVMHRDQHERVNEQVYEDADLARTDTPLVVKLGPRHFPVHGEEGIPADTLAVPPEFVEDAGLRNPPTLKEVLLAKADRARQLLRLSGGFPTGDAT